MTTDYVKLYKSLGIKSESDMASSLQRGVIEDELENLEKGLDQYNEEQKSQAIVHTRQDVVLLVSHVSALSRKMSKALFWLRAICLLLGLLVLVFYSR